MTYAELVIHLNSVENMAYEGFRDYADLYKLTKLKAHWRMADKYIKLHQKAWDIRIRMARDVQGGLL